MYLPGVPVHVVQRGHNRDACFFAEDDFRYYRQMLGEGLKRYGAELHAYCLMTNHVHLLITPEYANRKTGTDLFSSCRIVPGRPAMAGAGLSEFLAVHLRCRCCLLGGRPALFLYHPSKKSGSART